ncbi:MAG: glutaredoxin domain-containing protein [Nanoarchaeota archaeon]
MAVIVYGTQSCPWCKRAKDFLKSHKVKFTEKDVGNNSAAAEEMMKKSNQRGVPVIEVNGAIIVGFDEERLKRALKIS